MPSRKKAKGKARKAAKEAKAKEGESRTVAEAAVNQRQVQEEKLEERMERVIINDPFPTMCRHGCPPLSAGDQNIFKDFINEFMIIGAETLSLVNLAEAIVTVTKTTAEKFAEVYASKLDTLISMVLASGTQRVLDGNNKIAQLFACIAGYLEEWIAVGLHKTRAVPNLTKVIELYSANDHTLVSYYRNRIPCTCLDEKYKEVKSIKKMGRCHNPHCSHRKGNVERSKMFSCTQCGVANYCSAECQRAEWKIHKQSCGTAAEMIASFNSSQT